MLTLAPPPLVTVEKITPPVTGYARPLESTSGMGWWTQNGFFYKGTIRQAPKFEQAYDSTSSVSHGYLVCLTKTGTLVWDPIRGVSREFPRLWTGLNPLGPDKGLNFLSSQVDAGGAPIGFRNSPWQYRQNDPRPAVPMRGRQRLAVPPLTLSGYYAAIYAPPKGRLLAGTLVFRRKGSQATDPSTWMPTDRACLWTDDRKVPKLLPLLPGAGGSTAWGLNSGGDVIGTMSGVGSVVWRRSGRIEVIPTSHPLRLRPSLEPGNEAYTWRSQFPFLITEDGLVIAREGTYGQGMYVRMVWDGQTSIPMTEAIEGEGASGFSRVIHRENGIDYRLGGEVLLSQDGKSLLVGGGETSHAWYRLRRRTVVSDSLTGG